MKLKSLFVIMWLYAGFVLGKDDQKKRETNIKGLKISSCINGEKNMAFFKDKYVVIDVWATWCGPCIMGLPHFNELAETYRNNQNVTFATLTNEDSSKVVKFLTRREELKFSTLYLIDSNNYSWNYFGLDETGIPLALIFAPDGSLLFKGHPNRITTEMLDSVFRGRKIEMTKKILSARPAFSLASFVNSSNFFMYTGFTDSNCNYWENEHNNWSINREKITYTLKKTTIGEAICSVTSLSSFKLKTNDSVKANKEICLYYHQASNYFRECDTGFFPLTWQNYIVNTMKSVYGFEIHMQTEKDTAYMISIIDSTLLNKKAATLSTGGKASSSQGNNLSVVNNTLKDISTIIEDALSKPVFTTVANKSGYDLTINAENLNSVRQSLSTYGLELVTFPDFEIKVFYVYFR